MSIKLKSQVRTPKGLKIIRRAEISLLNERIISINNTINMLKQVRDTCIRKLEEKLDEDLMRECASFIEKRREARHQKTLSSQKRKLEALCQKSSFERGGCSNNMHSSKDDRSYPPSNTNETQINMHNNNKKKWVINISNQPLTTDEEKLLAHGPNYAIMPKDLPIAQYVAAIANACTRLEEGQADEFRVQVKTAIQ